ncbi:tRNA epoxyqueuosine(34) reductase QueG [Bradymonas sediminis]|uniref:tRNA epoxyqueuosine(34) reductase QueG n=1 Tax=Bradymonas sediminis TaxID=1548548 RepID=A0A2Z4FGK7_9DELT|nr:tRNA epoxyqueuosine(34) reductase QueG [Bradymonas sediminis]AWV87874.1 tRNA epoxyqueuosine(34) reductase QueG [Bradymonas sediminis]TDP62889.1 epoxyqueuosine reductase [Bradymonas sediminis]
MSSSEVSGAEQSSGEQPDANKPEGEPTLSDKIMARAIELGFDRAAIVPAGRLKHAEQYLEWLKEGRHGAMNYLDRHHELRVDPTKMEEGTRSVVVLLKNYYREADLLAGGLRIARYAHGDDYHDTLWERMRELAAFIHAETGADCGTRPATDTAPILERDLAALAGLGWVGKNAMLINPEIGSFSFIAEVLVDLDLEATHPMVPDRCGTCSKCIDACPTNAIISPAVIDARRCISYLTIELRGPIPRALRPLIGDHIFGCDICQVVCPWNSKAEPSEDASFQTREIYRSLTLQRLLCFDLPDYVEHFSKSAIKRAKLRGLRRNAAVVIGNTFAQSGDESIVELLGERLLKDEPEPLVRGHIAWALGQVGGDAAAQILCEAAGAEQDPYVQEEIRAAQR